MRSRWKNEHQKLAALAMAVEQTADHVMITDVEGAIEYFNPAFARTTGYDDESVLGQTPRILKSGQHDQSFYEHLWQVILSGQTFRAIITNKKKNGELYHADQTITPIKNEKGEIIHFVSVWKDITDRIVSQERSMRLKLVLEEEKNKLEQILDFDERVAHITKLDELVDFVVEKASEILQVERCSLMLLDEDTGELCIKSAKGLDAKIIKQAHPYVGWDVAGYVVKEGRSVLVKDITKDERFQCSKDPTYKTRSFLSVPIKLEDKILGVVSVTDKVSSEGEVLTELDKKILCAIVRQAAVAIENARLYKELKYLTVTDPLTNLYNYRHFMRSLEYEIDRVKRFERPMCLALMDVDDFGDYNKTFGQVAGDILLKDLGRLLCKNLRRVDIVCRYAADEFVVIFPETDVPEACVAVDKIMRKVREMKAKTPITISVGLVRCAAFMGRHDLISKADALLLEAKRGGKNRVVFENNDQIKG